MQMSAEGCPASAAAPHPVSGPPPPVVQPAGQHVEHLVHRADVHIASVLVLRGVGGRGWRVGVGGLGLGWVGGGGAVVGVWGGAVVGVGGI